MNNSLFFNAMDDPELDQASAAAPVGQRHYPEKPERIYLYGTCLVDMFYPQAGMDAIELLEQQGIEVIFPQNQSCCGQPAYTSGYEEEARAVAKSQIGCFEQPWPVIILSGSCGGMMRHHYPKLFKGDPEWQERANNLAARVFEFTEFLVNVLDFHPQDSGESQEVVLHTSCTARREMNVHKTGASLVDDCNNITRLVHDHESECCGFGGTFSVRYPDISGAMVNDKVKSLQATGAKQLVTADCGCLMNIMGAANKQQLDLKGEHIASWLLRRTGSTGGSR